MLMKQYIKILNNRAQSILELAIFGSIVLFLFAILIQYGMGLNQQEHLSMQTFRRALFMARTSRSRGPGGASLTVVKDVPMPNPSNPFGIGETSPVAAQASGVWSRDMSMEYEILDSELPRIDFMIDGVPQSYTTAAFGYHNCNGSMIRRKESNYANLPSRWDDPVSAGPCWYWETVEDRRIENGDVIDIDNDDKGESVIRTEGEEGDLDEFWYLDYQEGQIDTTIDPEEGLPQGLQPEYTKDVQVDASIVKDESGSGISTTRQSTAREIIRRIIRTRAGDQTISSDVTQEQSSSWQTNW